ncbi:hypothetical protein [Streptomyces sp. NPDC020817]|uniref:hypothetical protein n=1 Tax=Streptomyces sp. NPDC020817 TaxID=3365095 RepID=UPI003795B5BD
MKSPRGGGRPLAAALALATAGALLTYTGLHHTGPAQQAAPYQEAAPAPAPAASAGLALPSPSRAAASPGTQAVPTIPKASPQPDGPAPRVNSTPGELPPPGSGPAAAPLIQRALDRVSSPDLAPDDERALLDAGRAAWLAETVGYTRVRIQAATARRNLNAADGQLGAVVRLVWAGADPAGTLLDGRPATLLYTQNGKGSWKRTWQPSAAPAQPPHSSRP